MGRVRDETTDLNRLLANLREQVKEHKGKKLPVWVTEDEWELLGRRGTLYCNLKGAPLSTFDGCPIHIEQPWRRKNRYPSG